MSDAYLTRLTLVEWQSLLERYKREQWNAKPMAAFRIDHTVLSIARHNGGFTYDDDHYTVFYFAGGVMIGVRDNFKVWALRRLKKDAAEKKALKKLQQLDFGF